MKAEGNGYFSGHVAAAGAGTLGAIALSQSSDLLAGVLPLLVISFVMVTASPASASSPGWLNKCSYVRSLPDDPIVVPKLSGASHLHDFFGAKTTNAFSTYASEQAGGTSCTLATDTAGYWTPALYRNGLRVPPTGSYAGRSVREQIYYRDNNLNPGTKIEPFPADLRMVAGNGHAVTAAENPKLGKEIYWGCSDNSTSGKPMTPPLSCSTGIISLHVGFPNCWDGVLTHVNDTAHVVYPKSGVCPVGYPHALPRVIIRWEFPVGTTTGNITLSSGPSFTAHADFWNTWNQARLNSLVATCLNTDRDCGTPTT